MVAAQGGGRGTRSGPNIPEMDRRTTAVKLRLPRDVVDTLRELAERAGLTLSAQVAELVNGAAARASGDLSEAIPMSVHATIVDAYEASAKRATDAQKYVIEDLRARLAKYEPTPKKRKRPTA
jgi:predicted DNA-binding ribbon-helix-helix protein